MILIDSQLGCKLNTSALISRLETKSVTILLTGKKLKILIQDNVIGTKYGRINLCMKLGLPRKGEYAKMTTILVKYLNSDRILGIFYWI